MVLPPKPRGRKRGLGHDAGPNGRADDAHKKRMRSQSLGVHPQAPLKARPDVPSINMKHRSYYEIVENQNKKKKLEVKDTTDRNPPPGFEFVPMGNPDLTQACKDISREQDAMVFIVTAGIEKNALSKQIHRLGHHVRQTIVDQARQEIMDSDDEVEDYSRLPPGVPEPIPETQREIDEQADKAIRDLFPRIPHTDRRIIIEHSFKKGVSKKGEPLVGLAQDIPLYRRVQLAVLAHIRHTHTRYDKLLKETSYANARRVVEQLCLDTLVKWRGDEETGRDQLDEILREVIVISDSEEDGEDDSPETNSSGVESGDLREAYYRPRRHPPAVHLRPGEGPPPQLNQDQPLPWHKAHIPRRPPPTYAHEVRSKTERRGFKRYQNALSTRWDEARQRVRQQENHPTTPADHIARPPIHAQYGLAYEESQPIHVDDDDLQIIPDPRLAHPTEQPSRQPVRVPAQAHDAYRSISDGIQRGNSPYVERYRAQPQRQPVRSHEARDYLVSSIEPTPLPAEHRDFTPGPVFVRALSHQTEQGRVQEVQPHEVQEPLYRELDPHNRLEYYEQQRPQAPRLVSLQQVPEENRHYYIQPPSRPQMQPAAGPANELQSYQPYDGAVVEHHYREEPLAPANRNSWARAPTHAHPLAQQAPEYHGYPSVERREMRIEPVPGTQYHQVIEGHHEPPVDYYPPPAQVHYQRLQDRPPHSPAYQVEYVEPSSHNSLSVNNTPNAWLAHPSQEHPRQDHAYPATHSAQPQEYQAPPQLEPAPVFVRRVERYDQPQYLTSSHETSRRQYDDLVMRDADASPRHATDPWGQPVYTQERLHAEPQTERASGFGAYPELDRAQPPSGDAEYHGGYSEQQNGGHRYYQRGP